MSYRFSSFDFKKIYDTQLNAINKLTEMQMEQLCDGYDDILHTDYRSALKGLLTANEITLKAVISKICEQLNTSYDTTLKE